MSAHVPWLDRVAHDLRGPLAPLLTAVHLLRSGQVDAERRDELYDLIERQTHRLAQMADEIGDWSRAHQGTLVGARVPCEFALLLDAAISACGEHGRGLPAHDDSDGAIVDGDAARLVQMLRMLGQYVCARPGAAPTLRLQRDGAWLRIEIEDGGAPAGDDAQLARLLTQPLSEPHDHGLGLKLPIARAIAEAHGGTLEAARAPRSGLRLLARLPLSTSAGS